MIPLNINIYIYLSPIDLSENSQQEVDVARVGMSESLAPQVKNTQVKLNCLYAVLS